MTYICVDRGQGFSCWRDEQLSPSQQRVRELEAIIAEQVAIIERFRELKRAKDDLNECECRILDGDEICSDKAIRDRYIAADAAITKADMGEAE